MKPEDRQKLRAVAIRRVTMLDPKKVDHRRASAALSSIASSFTGLDKQSDLLHVEAVLVSEGINDNDDAFLREELKKAINSPVLKPMNWQHRDSEILGAMYAVQARDMSGNPLTVDEIKDQPIELAIQGVVWHYLPHIKTTAEEIVKRIDAGDLFVSMECWFDNYDYGLYTEAGELYDRVIRAPGTAFLDSYLRVNGGKGVYNGMRIGRALSGVNFGGVAFVDRPANKRSLILNHFAFDPMAESQEIEASRDDEVVTSTTLFENEEPMEVTMNDQNRTAASADQITQSVQEALAAQKRAEAAERVVADLEKAVARNVELEAELAKAKATAARLESAVEKTYSRVSASVPAEIAKIDAAMDGGPEALFAAKLAWIADSHKTVAQSLASVKDGEGDTTLLEENTALKAELTSIKQALREDEIKYLFAEILGLEEEEVAKFVKAGLAKATDELYQEWLDEKKIFARKMIELKKKDKKGKEDKKDDAEAGVLTYVDQNTRIDQHGATLRPELGKVPSSIPLVPRSRITASADLDAMFEEISEPNLGGSTAAQDQVTESPMAKLVAGLFSSKQKKEDN